MAKQEQTQFAVISRVKEYIAEHDEMRTAGDFADALSVEIQELIDKAIKRASAAGRKTVQSVDV